MYDTDIDRVWCDRFTMTAFISPYRADRDKARERLPEGRFIEIYLQVPLHIAEQRDPKGLYEKARKGEIKEFTGISAPYEEPLNPELVVDTGKLNVKESTDLVLNYLKGKNIIITYSPHRVPS